jgi:DNA-binding MarR family transcriptional regulator
MRKRNADGDEVTSILRAILALGRRLRAERPQGSMTLSALSVLGTLSRLRAISATRLAAEERLQPQSLTRLVLGLERKGLIARTRSAVDRRELAIALTRKGQRVLDEDLELRRAWLEQAVAAELTVKERGLLYAASSAMLKLAFSSGSGDGSAR